MLGKSAKVPPVMILDFFVNRRVYSFVEYCLGLVILMGAVLFQAPQRARRANHCHTTRIPRPMLHAPCPMLAIATATAPRLTALCLHHEPRT